MPKEQLIFNQFYSADILRQDNRSSTERIFFHPGLYENAIRLPRGASEVLREAQISDAYTLFHMTSMEDAMQHYRRLHNAQYMERIATLAGRLPKHFFTKWKPTIVMAAMNELETDTAIEAARSAYDGDFAADIHVLVYHNYKSEPHASVKQAMAALHKFPNVAVVEELVPSMNTVACAKKTANDILQMRLPLHIDIPIILMDADVKGLSSGTVNAGLQALDNHLAASPGYNYDPAACARFPVLAYVWQIAQVLRQKKLDLDSNTSKATIGPFTSTTRKSLALVGGLKPVLIAAGRPAALVAYEDIQFSKDLARAITVDSRFKHLHPVADLGAAHFHVLLDAAREIEALVQGKRFDERWLLSKRYNDVSGSKRFDWRLIDTTDPNIAAVPELCSATPANLQKAMSNFFRAHILQSLGSLTLD